jgi:hypothetical protein
MIESMKIVVLEHEFAEYGTTGETLFTTIQDILISRWDKNCTPLYCLAHSLNPKYYTNEWLNCGPSHRFPPHMDGEISQGRKDAFRQIFQDRAYLDCSVPFRLPRAYNAQYNNRYTFTFDLHNTYSPVYIYIYTTCI